MAANKHIKEIIVARYTNLVLAVSKEGVRVSVIAIVLATCFNLLDRSLALSLLE